MKNYWKVILLLAIPLLCILLYGWSDISLPNDHLSLTKIDMTSVKEWWKNLMSTEQKDTIVIAKKDTVKTVTIDTTHQRILFFGDSMLEGLSRRLRTLSEENGDTVTAVCWYSSTSELWAKTDTLDFFLRKVQPTYIMICLCANEQFVRDLPERGKNIDRILQRINDYTKKHSSQGAPCKTLPLIWIAPPSWKQDTGINALIKKKVGERRFFDSTRLTFRRGSDHMHPTFSSAAEWMDSISVWMESKNTEYPIRMKATQPRLEKDANAVSKPKGKLQLILLQPYELTKQ